MTGDTWQFHIPTNNDRAWLDTALKGNLAKFTTKEVLTRAKTFIDNKGMENSKYVGPFPRIISRQSTPSDRIAYMDADILQDGLTNFRLIVIWPDYRGQKTLAAEIMSAAVNWKKKSSPWSWTRTNVSTTAAIRPSFDNIGVTLEKEQDADDEGFILYSIDPTK